MITNDNPILDVDSYKTSHYLQYPSGTSSMFSYVESRGGLFQRTLFFGLQPILLDLAMPITMTHVDEAEAFCLDHGVPFPRSGWEYIVRDLGGRLPVRIRALPEGTVAPTRLPLVTVESTDPRHFWVVGWIETKLMRVWYPTTVATLSMHAKLVIRSFLEETADDLSGLPFKLHDFGARGVSSRESAALGGAAHLVNFMGSDTIEGVLLANRAYGFSPTHKGPRMAGFSIPAAEHSTITSWGREGEAAAYGNMLDKFARPGAIVACVSDSYDLMHAVEALWGQELRQRVIDSGATVVIRPDSGDPAQVVCATLNGLAGRFGCTVSSKGYRVLNHVRVIQGDGINLESIAEILRAAKEQGFSADNLAFGMGGALLQGVNRDTQKFAMKCSSVTVDGTVRDVFKDPVTDRCKRSQPGRLDVISHPDFGLLVERLAHGETARADTAMVTVFEDGNLTTMHRFDEIRARSGSWS